VIPDHRFYEMQSALSATGHLTGSELEELEQHVSQCVSCRTCMVEMARVSRELFLTQVRPRSVETPREMQHRFMQRAVAAGIPLRLERASSAGFDLRFAGVTAITVVLALLLSLGWKVASTAPAERASGQFPSQMETTPKAFSEGTPQSPGGHAGHTALVSERRIKRRPAVLGRAVLKGSPVVGYGDVPHPYPALNRPLFTKPYVAGLFGRKWDDKPEERSFHLDLTLAALSRSGSPLNAGSSALVPNLKFSTPVFHIDPRQNW
jgi:hypothetical protein